MHAILMRVGMKGEGEFSLESYNGGDCLPLPYN